MNENSGRITRRRAIGLAGASGAGLLLAGRAGTGFGDSDEAEAAACILTPEEEEGPFYVDLERVRANIREDRKGVPFVLLIKIVNSTTCKPIKNAAVDIWHADAVGEYSAESSQGTSGETWLRGVQLTNAKGVAEFRTIYPGFYQGRATHIHVKAHIGGRRSGSKYSGGHVAHTGQLFMPDSLSTAVYKLSPYTKDPNSRTLHGADRVYTQQHGSSSVLTCKRRGTSLAKSGIRGSITLGVDPSA